MIKIRQRDIRDLRLQILQEQHNLCAICNEHLDIKEAVLDHDHKTGYIRAVLHRGCNAFIGHIENNQARNRITPSRLQAILKNFLFYTSTHRPIIHPTHKTPEERIERAKKRRKRNLGKSKPKTQ